MNPSYKYFQQSYSSANPTLFGVVSSEHNWEINNSSQAIIEGLVSVIIPTYNRKHLMLQTLHSVIQQTYPKIELIVVDDGSTDGTSKDVTHYLQSRCKYEYAYLFVDHKGCATARNIGLNIARGEFVQHLDSDDILLPMKIEKQTQYMRNNPATGVVYCFSETVNNEMPPNVIGRKAYNPNNIFAFILRPWVSISDPLVLLWRRSAISKVGYYDARLCRWVDWDYLVRYLSLGGIVGCLKACLAQYRVHANRVTSAVHGKDGIRDAESCVIALQKAYGLIRNTGNKGLIMALSDKIWTTLCHLVETPHESQRMDLIKLLINAKEDSALSLFAQWSMHRNCSLNVRRAKYLYCLYGLRRAIGQLQSINNGIELYRMCMHKGRINAHSYSSSQISTIQKN